MIRLTDFNTYHAPAGVKIFFVEYREYYLFEQEIVQGLVSLKIRNDRAYEFEYNRSHSLAHNGERFLKIFSDAGKQICVIKRLDKGAAHLMREFILHLIENDLIGMNSKTKVSLIAILC